jgi:hypothetical protein
MEPESDDSESPGGNVPELTAMSVHPGHGSLSLMSSEYGVPAVAVGQM